MNIRCTVTRSIYRSLVLAFASDNIARETRESVETRVLTCNNTVPQCHDHFNILRSELVYIFGRLRERRQLRAVENHLAAADSLKEEEENHSNIQRLHSSS